jgi:membrane glycosyltransferase
VALRRFALADGVVASGIVLLCACSLCWFAHRGGLHARGVRVCAAADRGPAHHRLKDYRGKASKGVSTALVFPIYNEEVAARLRGLRATYQSLQKTGLLDRFDFYILSDSTDPDKWVEEERRWFDLVQRHGRAGPHLLSPARGQRREKERQHPRFFEHLGPARTAILLCLTPTASCAAKRWWTWSS